MTAAPRRRGREQQGARSSRRIELAQAAAVVLLERGLADLSLRSIAAAIGTSHRVLLYHFDSLDDLLAAAFEESRLIQTQMASQVVLDDASTSPSEQVGKLWKVLASRKAEPGVRVFFEMLGRAIRDPDAFPGFARRSVVDWIDFSKQTFQAAGLTESEAATEATLVIAVFRGLLADLVSTRERKRVERALETFLQGLDQKLAASYEGTAPPA